MAARLNSNGWNDSPFRLERRVGKTVFESRCSRTLNGARLRESWGPGFAETPINDRSNDHASDSSSIHDREGTERADENASLVRPCLLTSAMSLVSLGTWP